MGIAIGLDITERKQTEKRLALLAEISEMLRNVEDPNELIYAISRAIGEHLQVKRVLFNEIDLEHDHEVVHRDYHNGLESVAGVHRLSDYSSITSQEVASGKTVVNADSKTDPRTAQDYEKTYASSGERAYVVVPMMRDNRWVASLWVSDDAPRDWSRDDVSLLETIAERTWTVIEKLRIAEELRAKEAELEEIINHTPFMLTRCSHDLRYRFVSRAYAEMIGRTPEEVRGKPIVEIMGEEGLRVISPYVEKVLAGERVEYESEVSFKDVGAPFLHVVYTPNRNEQGDVIGWFGSIVDISGRKRAEEKLRQSEERFRQAANASEALIYEVDLLSGATAVVYGMERLVGYDPQETVISSNWWHSLIHPEDLPAHLAQLEEFLTRGGTDVSEYRVRHKSGEWIVVQDNRLVVQDDAGYSVRLVGAVIDITERKRIEEALRRNEKMFSTLVEAAPFGVYFIDSDFRLRAINKGSQAVFSGINPLIGRDFAEILRIIWQEPFATEAIERFRHTLRTGEPFISP
ncbi:MAG TPA: PAS domain S-box protein, partial [Blastocatellia bacterium]